MKTELPDREHHDQLRRGCVDNRWTDSLLHTRLDSLGQRTEGYLKSSGSEEKLNGL
jgi:hypothetical protein